MHFNADQIKKILCIKPRGIGDIVLSTIILDNLYDHFPGIKIDYLTEHFAIQALEDNPLVNKVLSMKKKEFPLFVANRIRKEKYDMILDLWSNPRSAQITLLSGVRYKVGYNYRGRGYAYNIKVKPEKIEQHAADDNLSFLKAIGIPVKSKAIHYYISKEDAEWAIDFINKSFNENNSVIGIVPSGGWRSKRCDASKWVEIGNKIKDNINLQFLILWGPGDEKDANFINENLSPDSILAPETDVKKLSALINNCNLIIANDSGPMHIAGALNVPTLGIFGPTNPAAHRPYSVNSDFVIKDDLHCIICNKLNCPYNHECMLELSTDEVLLKVKKLLKIDNPEKVNAEKD
jgi:lipopolysaccharide heptosyltransferase II